MTMRRWIGLLGLAWLTLTFGCAQSRPNAPQLISTAQLAQRLNDPNLPLSRAIPRFEPQTRTAQPNPELFRTLEWLQKYLDSPEPVQVLDARAPQQYQAGHIPTAQNLFLRDLLRSEGGYSVWRSPDEIRDKVRQLGIDPARPLVVYCNSGREASQVWFTLRALLGIEAQVYDGSWVEWSAHGLPTEKGRAAP
jgi:3-mercaptopyruvate sulfurtransferase SseA